MKEELDKLIQLYNNNVDDKATIIESILKIVKNITKGNNILGYIKNIVNGRELTYTQYTLLLDIVKLLNPNKDRSTIDIDVKLKYVEDSTGYKKYTLKEIEYEQGLSMKISSEVGELLSILGIQSTLVVIRVLCTFRN